MTLTCLAQAYEQALFPSAQRIFPFSNLNPFPFKPMETKIRENNFYDMQTISLLLSLCLSNLVIESLI